MKYFITGLLLTMIACNENSTNKSTPREKFTDNIRTTAFRTPAEEQAGFKLPEGFEITLYASEPDIGKPMNMEFDDKGRLWVTQSYEYPMPVDKGHGSDKLSILEDTDGDGRADKFTHFVDTLNIPIGVLPVTDGAIAYSIPAINYYRDADNDGKADQQKILFKGFGHKDTHGMVSNLIRGFDGWIYSCHGFSNTSRIAGADGDSVIMTSGNTFRFKTDGSHVEQTSYGRVNPFGYAYDEKGYLYSVDCHTKPIYQMINGGEYPGFGKKAPGIGYAPEMMSYELGSTAISGLEYYIGEQFPEEYRNCFYSGDVVTCEINRNTITYKGTTPVSKREEDFVVSDDPWFRPVAITIGPDGAMYIADFYNRIIGHYEVALDHPGRDKISGRIWRITYKGNKTTPIKDWSKASIDELIQGLENPQLTTRMKIADRLADVFKEKSITPLNTLLNNPAIKEHSYVQALWILTRLNALNDLVLNKALTTKNNTVRIHALRILGEKDKITNEQKELLVQALSDADPHIQRAAATVLGKFKDFQNIRLLLDVYAKTDTADTHLLYTALLSVRNNLKDKRIIKQVVATNWTDAQLAILTKAIQDAPSEEGASFMMNYLSSHNLPQDQMISRLEYVGRYLPASKLDGIINLIRRKFANDQESQFVLYSTIRQGVAQNGSKPSTLMKQWGETVAATTLNNITETSDPWNSRLLERDREKDYPNPWVSRDDFFYPMVPKFRVIYSEKYGYVPTGVLVSRPFKLPAKLSMNIFDYSIHPTDERVGISDNTVRIRLKANNEVIGEYRLNQKTPSKIEDVVKVDYAFDLKKWEGQEGFIEATDSSAKGSFGIGNIQPEVVPVPGMVEADLEERRLKAIEIADEYKSLSLAPALKNIATAEWMSYKIRMAAANALANVNPEEAKDAVVKKMIARSKANALPANENELINNAEVRKERDKIIEVRLKNFAASSATAAEGKTIFVQNCSMCHSVKGSGGMIGPQLDGIGNWGAKALMQKIIDPNRNISEAFRLYNIKLKNGKQLSGLYRRTEGEVTVYADVSGKEFAIAKNDLQEATPSKYTLMPDQFRNTISEQDFSALLKYLTSVK